MSLKIAITISYFDSGQHKKAAFEVHVVFFEKDVENNYIALIM